MGPEPSAIRGPIRRIQFITADEDLQFLTLCFHSLSRLSRRSATGGRPSLISLRFLRVTSVQTDVVGFSTNGIEGESYEDRTQRIFFEQTNYERKATNEYTTFVFAVIFRLFTYER